MKKLVFLAHRGATKPKLHNRNEAIQSAVESGLFDYVEVDIRRTRSDEDGQRVVILSHDPTMDDVYDRQKVPASQRTESGVRLIDLDFSALNNSHAAFTTLKEAIKSVGETPLDLDIKDASALPLVVDIIKTQSESENSSAYIIISAFDWLILRKSRELAPDIPIMMLYGPRHLLHRSLAAAKRLRVDAVNINKWVAPFVAPFFAMIGVKQRYVYTVNRPFEVYLLRLFGINGFTTDRISLARRFSS